MKVITKANNILNGISSSSVCTEVIQSAQGMEYLLGEESQTRHIHTHTHSRIILKWLLLLKNTICGLPPSEGQMDGGDKTCEMAYLCELTRTCCLIVL